jgi:hypothetical protein
MWTKIRLRSVWAFVPLYLLLARPTVPLILAGLVFALAGGLVRAWAAGAIRKNRVLTTHGPYAFTRNPLYVGTFLIGLGFAIASGVVWFLVGFLVFFAVVYGKTMRREETRLEELFGEEFGRYATAVPRFLPRMASWSDVTGETSPARPAPAGATPEEAGGVAVMEAPAVTAVAPFQLQRYLANREYQALLGLAIMFLALAAKLAL